MKGIVFFMTFAPINQGTRRNQAAEFALSILPLAHCLGASKTKAVLADALDITAQFIRQQRSCPLAEG